MAETTTRANSSSKMASNSLQTPVSASYPSELRSPMAGTPGFIKQEEGARTPITPPVAYLDFLKHLSPGLMSPATGASSKFNFNEKCPEKPKDEHAPDEKPSRAEASSSDRSTPMTQPPLSRTASSESTTSTSTTSSNRSSSYATSTGTRTRPESPRITIPPSPFAVPMSSARTPRRIQIPQSPFSPATARSPMSARSMQSPYSASGLSATPWSATYSPAEWDMDRHGKSSKVCVRQVVTRTVTYAKTPLDPAPKGKRRKVEETKEES